ncbi:MAG: hypothetical protein ABEJ80_01885 [Halarchaeum sp.]
MSKSDSTGLQTSGTTVEPQQNIELADTGLGALVYEVETEYRSHIGREVPVAKQLVGFADVQDWDAIREALRARGHGVGATYHLPTYETGANGTLHEA